MTDTIENQDADELDRLRQKNAELLAELKRVKAKSNENADELESLRQQVRELRLDKPLEAMLEDLFLVSPRLARGELAEHYQFDLDETGAIVMLDTEGERVMLEEPAKDQYSRPTKRPLEFNREDLSKVLGSGKWDHILRGSRATGGGASGSRSGGIETTKPEKVETPSPRAGFGLK